MFPKINGVTSKLITKFLPWVVTANFFAGASVPEQPASAQDKLVPSASSNTILAFSQSKPAQANNATQLRELRGFGFVQIGKSNLYKRGDFIIEVSNQGAYTPFVDYCNRWVHYNSVQGIKKGGPEFPNSFSLDFLQVENGKIKAMDVAPGGYATKTEERLSAFPKRKLSIKGQLESIGFVPDKQESMVYRQTIRAQKHDLALIAILGQHGSLDRVLQPIDWSTQKKFVLGTKVINYKIATDTSNPANPNPGKVSILTVSNATMRFSISGPRGEIVEGSQRLFRPIRLEELGVSPIKIKIEQSGFKIGGTNSTTLIRGLEKIHGRFIYQLEDRLRESRDLENGFLGFDEKLLEVLAKDNNFVLSKELTHQMIAEQLKYCMELYAHKMGDRFEYHGNQYQMDVDVYMGGEISPFDDETVSEIEITVTNLTNGKRLKFSRLLSDLIERYGFYGGEESSCRLDPREIIQVFPYLKQQSKKP